MSLRLKAMTKDTPLFQSADEDILSPVLLQQQADPFYRFCCLSEATSTNALLKQNAQGEQEGLVLIAEKQTAGHGRFGRHFFSPAHCGLYMSILLRPSLPAAVAAPLLTVAAATAVTEAAEALSGEAFGIKWVNDVLKDGKKVAGILTEGALCPTSDRLEYAVLGIGINVHSPKEGFDSSLAGVAGAVFSAPRPHARLSLASKVLERFLYYYRLLPQVAFRQSYLDHSLLVGQDVTISFPAWDRPARQAKVTGIDEQFRLCVRYGNGEEEALNSGEVSAKPI